jgi:hypothetical protein
MARRCACIQKPGALIERFGIHPRTQRPAHYLKQPDECVRLVPGEPRLVAAVQRMFKRKFIDGWGPWRIAGELNAEGICGPTGGKWHRCAASEVAVKFNLQEAVTGFPSLLVFQHFGEGLAGAFPPSGSFRRLSGDFARSNRPDIEIGS